MSITLIRTTKNNNVRSQLHHHHHHSHPLDNLTADLCEVLQHQNAEKRGELHNVRLEASRLFAIAGLPFFGALVFTSGLLSAGRYLTRGLVK